MNTKLVRISEKAFEGLCAVAGKLQAREKRRVSLDDALCSLLFPKSERENEEKTASKRGGVHTALNLKKGVAPPKKRGKTTNASKKSEAHLVREPLKRFSLKHKKFVAE